MSAHRAIGIVTIVIFGSGIAHSAPVDDPCGADGPCAIRDDVTLRGLRGVEVEFIVEDTVEHLWAFIADCMRWPEYIHFFGPCEPIEVTPERGRYRSTMFIAGRRFEVICDATRERDRRIEFHQVTGDFRALYGRWALEPIGPGRTRVRYALAADLAWYVPARTVRGRLRQLMPDVVRGVRRYAAERP